MTDYVLVQSNWASINSVSLDLVCDVDIEEDETQLTKNTEQLQTKESNLSNEKITHIILRSDQPDQQDSILTLTFLQPDKYQLQSIQLLSNARHTEFYSQEYLGSCQGSRITELNNDSIYESIFEFNQPNEKLTLKCLKLADTTDLIIYCLQISLKKIETDCSMSSKMSLPFDLNRVRSMIDESNLSTNARQFMANLHFIQENRQSKENSSQQLNLCQMMSMMKGLTTSVPNPQRSPPTLNQIKSTVNETLKSTSVEAYNNSKEDLDALESRLQTYIDRQFIQLQQHIDKRFDRLEEKLIQLK